MSVDYPEGFLREIERSRERVTLSEVVGSVLGVLIVAGIAGGVTYWIVKRKKRARE